MTKSKFTEEQIAFALEQAETGTTVEEICRKMGISQATFYAWRKKFGGFGVAELRRLRQLEEENRKLNQLVADLCHPCLLASRRGSTRSSEQADSSRAPRPEHAFEVGRTAAGTQWGRHRGVEALGLMRPVFVHHNQSHLDARPNGPGDPLLLSGHLRLHPSPGGHRNRLVGRDHEVVQQPDLHQLQDSLQLDRDSSVGC